jgi:hypothetical protein
MALAAIPTRRALESQTNQTAWPPSDLAAADIRAGRAGDGSTIEIEDDCGNLIESMAIRQALY